MKKTLIILVLCAVLPAWAEAQTDTVQWGYDKYHYSVWYDTLPEFFNTLPGTKTPALNIYPWYCNSIGHVTAYPQHVDRPTLVQGVAVTERLNYNSDLSIIQHHQYTEEYVYLFQKVGDTVELLDSVRWDTLTPKVMKIALNADTGDYGFRLIKVYEAMFNEPIMVDSVFYTLSSNNGGNAYCGSMHYEFVYYPAEPMEIYHSCRMITDPAWCPLPSWFVLKQWALYRGRQWVDHYSACNSPLFGMYFPIVDYVNLIVTSADTTMGTAEPDIRVSRNTWQSIQAIPKRGYKFSHWQEDSSTLATQSLCITQDTTHYTAVFVPKVKYRLDVRSNDERRGHVVGDSTYYEGDTATIEAFATYGYVFDRWSTGDTANPLLLTMESDTVITAYFSARQLGIETPRREGASFTLTPNPAHNTVTVCTSDCPPNATLTLHNASGRKSLTILVTMPCLTIPLHDFPAGIYLVTLTTNEGSSTQRLVVK